MAEPNNNLGQTPTPPPPPLNPPDKPPQPELPQQKQQAKQPAPFRRAPGEKPKKGDLVGFRYMFWKHDPHPLVLVTDHYPDGKVAGVNLHNLTLWDMKNLVSQYCNKGSISYQVAVKGRKEISKGFRTYRWDGVKDLMIFNCANFLARLGIVREKRLLSPSEVEKMRLQIQQQLKRQINPRADDMTRHSQNAPIPSTGTIPGKSASIPGNPVGGQESGE